MVFDVRVDTVLNSPGLYYQHEGEAGLYNSEWRVVTFSNLQEVSDSVDIVGRYAEQTVGFCKKYDHSLWLNLTECRTSTNDASGRLVKLKEMRSIVSQLTNTFWKDNPEKIIDFFIWKLMLRDVHKLIGYVSYINYYPCKWNLGFSRRRV